MGNSICVFSQSTDEQNVQETLDQMAAALRSNNTVALGSLYSNDYTSVDTRAILLRRRPDLKA